MTFSLRRRMRRIASRRTTLRTIALALLTAGLADVATAQDHPLGDWHGMLGTPMGKLTLVFHFARQASDTVITGTMESVDQAPGNRIPLAQVNATSMRLTFTIPAIGATYDGNWDAAAQAFTGEFRQGAAMPLTITRGLPPARPVIEGLDGRWEGSLARGDTRLRLVLHVNTTESGTRVTLDSPDLTAFGLPVEHFERRADSVTFTVPSSDVTFRGTLGADGQSLRGRWMRSGQPETMVEFTRASAAPVSHARSQWPLRDARYQATDVRFPNAKAPGVTLAGTLTIPEGAGPFPAAVLISGSGAQDRDETVFGHKPFAVLAHHLTNSGIAVLRFDDRGFGASTGDHDAATSADFATDALAAMEFLRARPEIDREAIGLIGHSEGGLIGPIAAASDTRVAWLIMLAGPGTSTVELALAQRRAIGISQGISEAQIDRSEPLVRKILDEVRTTKDTLALPGRVRALLTPEAVQALGASDVQRESLVERYAGPWMRFFLAYEPARHLTRVRAPILALGGSLDMQVPSAENLAGLRSILAGHPDATITELPQLNHFFQTAKTGAMGEYLDIAETFSPAAMTLISEWILARFAAGSAKGSVR